jgi:hypothetical protein
MPTAIESQIKERIQAFVSELDVMVRKSTLEALRDVLQGGGAGPARRGRGRPAGGGSTEGLAEKIASHVAANAGQTVGEIVAATGARPAAVKKVIKAMLSDKAIRKTGKKRGTRYFPPGAGRLPGAVARRARKVTRRRRAKKAKAA